MAGVAGEDRLRMTDENGAVASKNAVLIGVIDRIAFDYGVELHVEGAVVRIEGDAVVGDSGTESIAFSAERPSQVAKELLVFLHADVCVELAGSALTIRLAGSDKNIEIAPSSEYEAWSVVLADGSRFVCGADGEVSRWSVS